MSTCPHCGKGVRYAPHGSCPFCHKPMDLTADPPLDPICQPCSGDGRIEDNDGQEHVCGSCGGSGVEQ